MITLILPNATKENFYQTLTTVNLRYDLLISKALQQAEQSHRLQLRDDKGSYLEQHIYPVAIETIEYYKSGYEKGQLRSETVAGALLHDVLEDDKNIDDTLFIEKFGEEVYGLVKPLSKSDYQNYPGKSKRDKKMALNLEYKKILKSAPRESKIIKLADRYENICCVHASPKPGKIEDYISDTEEFYLPWAKEDCVYFYEKIRVRIEMLRENMTRQ